MAENKNEVQSEEKRQADKRKTVTQVMGDLKAKAGELAEAVESVIKNHGQIQGGSDLAPVKNKVSDAEKTLAQATGYLTTEPSQVAKDESIEADVKHREEVEREETEKREKDAAEQNKMLDRQRDQRDKELKGEEVDPVQKENLQPGSIGTRPEVTRNANGPVKTTNDK